MSAAHTIRKKEHQFAKRTSLGAFQHDEHRIRGQALVPLHYYLIQCGQWHVVRIPRMICVAGTIFVAFLPRNWKV